MSGRLPLRATPNATIVDAAGADFAYVPHLQRDEIAPIIVRAVNCRGELVSALKPFSFCDAETPPEGVAVADWRAAVLAARAALAKAEASHG